MQSHRKRQIFFFWQLLLVVRTQEVFQVANEKQKSTIVLVHGAWSDGSIWKDVLLPLAHAGYRVRAAQIGLLTFEADVAAVESLLDQVEGPVLLVGHSYGGAVISAAGNHEKVKALAYVTAFAPNAGEVFGSLMSMHPAKAQMNIAPDAQGLLWVDSAFAAEALGHDLHRGVIHLAVAVQKPTAAALFSAKLDKPAWQSKPSAYLVTADDRILAPETQRELAKRIGARTEEVAASHLVVLSQAEAVAKFIETSAAAV
jgi:pimeloyl-ACP methyl ester carboxylesterase